MGRNNNNDDGLLVRIIRMIGQILAIVAVVLWILTLLNRSLAGFGVLDGKLFLGDLTTGIEFARNLVTFLSVVFIGFGFAVKRVPFLILYSLLVIVLVVLMFFPGLLGWMVGYGA